MNTQRQQSFFRFLILFIGIKILIILWFFIYFSNKVWPEILSNGAQMCFHQQCFSLEMAKTPLERRIGLSGREKLGEWSGMLFAFDEPGKYNFYMQDTFIPLDILRIDRLGKVLQIIEAEPCKIDNCPTYEGAAWAFRVIELNQWISRKIWIQTWDILQISE